MNTLKHICLTITLLVKQAWLLPKTIATGMKQKRQQMLLSKPEVERLDRIRNPAKYLGR